MRYNTGVFWLDMTDDFDIEAFLSAVLDENGKPVYVTFLEAIKDEQGDIDLDKLYTTLEFIEDKRFQMEVTKHRQEASRYKQQGDNLKARVKDSYIRVKAENKFNTLIGLQQLHSLEGKVDPKSLQPDIDRRSGILGKGINSGRTMMQARMREAEWPIVVGNQAVLLQTSLPRHDQGDYQTWEVKNGESAVQLRAGSKPDKDGRLIPGKLPWGKLPRLILFYVNVLVNSHRNPEVKLGNSVSQFLLNAGVSRQGASYETFYEQMDNLMRCSVVNSYQYEDVGWPDAEMYSFSREGSRTTYQNVSDQIDEFTDRVHNKEIIVTLSQAFYQSMLDNPLDISMRSIKALGKNLLAMDIFAMLAERLPRIEEGQQEEISRAFLEELFGSTYEDKGKFFRETFKPALDLVKEKAYKNANFTIEKNGLILFYSPPASLEHDSVYL